LEIVLREVHVGPCGRVVTLGIEGHAPAHDFLATLITSNPHAAKSLQTSMATITAVADYHNDRKFKRVAPGIFEIKAPGVRLYCFRDRLGDDQPMKLIVATNGGDKNTRKEQDGDIKRASRIRERYLALKDQKDAVLRYIQNQP